MDFRSALRHSWIQACALAGLALLAGTLSNLAASRQRRLDWGASPVPTAVVSAAPPALPQPPAPVPVVPAPPAPAPAPARAPRAVPPPPAFPPDPDHPVREITSADAWRAFQAKVRFLDARRSADYAEGHVAGAWCAPVWEADVDTRITIFEATTHPASKDALVLYCAGGDCEDSHMLASRLLKLGYRNLLVYRGGYPDWVEQGRPVARGDQ